MAVGVGAMAVEPAAGAVETFDHPVVMQGFEVLIHRSVADAPAVSVELLKDVAGAEMAAGAPENLEHQSALTTQAQAPIPAIPIGSLQTCSTGRRRVPGEWWRLGAQVNTARVDPV